MQFELLARFVAAALLAFLVTSRAAAGDGPSLCCPSDLDGDGSVAAGDLAVLLGSWGPVTGEEPSDLDGSGEVDAGDLATLLGAWGLCPVSCLKTLVVGRIELSDGTPVSRAVVLTDLGGQGVSGADGSFSFEVEVVEQTNAINATAVATLDGVTYTGTKLVSPIELDGVTDAGTIVISADAGCSGAVGWLPGFGAPGMNKTVYALTVFDDGSGSGPAIYAGGEFTTAGSVLANRIAKWDGSVWSTLGSGSANGVNNTVYALTVFDDGAGPALYAGGLFTTAGGVTANRIAQWDGASWSSLGTGAANGVSDIVHALTVFDDGSGGGPALYAGGNFTLAGGGSANRVAKWNGSAWSSLGTGAANGVNGIVHALTEFDDGSGSGPMLYAGGAFTMAGGATANRIAKWNGSSWSSLGTGAANGVISTVYALAVFDDGPSDGFVGGPALYVGGAFTSAGGVTASGIARWDGSSWSSLGTGSANGMNQAVFALKVFDDGSGDGPVLYAGGAFTTAGGVTANRLAKWDGTSWSSLGANSSNGVNDTVFAFEVSEVGSGGGAALFAGGAFPSAVGKPVNNIATWDGTALSALVTDAGNGMNATIFALTVFDDGSGGGPALYAGGSFGIAGGVAANSIAKWDGTSWSALGIGTGALNGTNNTVHALTVFDDGSGSGPALYAGGAFTTAGGVTANRIAKWNGSSWSSLGTGANSTVRAISIFDDGSGSGPALYAGGLFTSAGGLSVNFIAKWNGTTWSSLGTGSANGVNAAVEAITVFDDGPGDGTGLYAGGAFTAAGGVTASRIAKWDGTSWSSLGTGAANGVSSTVWALTVFDDGLGGGPALFAGGGFMTAGGVAANRIAKWDGAEWSSLGTGSANGMNGLVYALTAFDDGSGGGQALYAGGSFTTAGGVTANRIAKWDGSAWSSLGTGFANGVNDVVWDLAVLDDASESAPALFAGGGFMTAGGAASLRIAQWGCTASNDDAANGAAGASESRRPVMTEEKR